MIENPCPRPAITRREALAYMAGAVCGCASGLRGAWGRSEHPSVVNVVGHGADPTGRTDNTVLLTDLHASGRRIYYPDGTYRFNGKTLPLSGGVAFESREGVTVRNDISPENILEFDDSGLLIGLQQNHLELDQRQLGDFLPTGVGSLVRPPVSPATPTHGLDMLAFWYNDFGLEYTRLQQRLPRPGGWIGWYYWTWNFHNAVGDGYDPSRHPLLGFYRGDDPTVLDWQCFWLREYGVAGVILVDMTPIDGWEQPAHHNYWAYRLFHDVPNFRGLKYVMTAPARYERSTPEAAARIEQQWLALIQNTYFAFPNCYVISKNGKQYPLIYLFEEAALAGIFDSYAGQANTNAFYRRIAALFRSKGYGGFAVLGRHPLKQSPETWDSLEKDGVLHFDGGYSDAYATGSTYAQLVENYDPPVGERVIINTCTSKLSHTPHPSKWTIAGSSPALFRQLLRKAADHIAKNGMPQIVTCYNVAEWAEGGSMLQPDIVNRFGYLQAVKDVLGATGRPARSP